MEHRGHIPVKHGSERSFAFLFGFICASVGIYFLVGTGGILGPVLVGAAILLVAGGIFFPQVLHRPNRAWIKLGFLLGAVMSPLVLGLIYFVVLTPIALLSRVFGSDPLRLRRRESRRDTFWLDRDSNDHSARSMTRQY